MSEWKTIDTAPKDGSSILVLFEGKPHVARWAPVFHPDNVMWVVDHADRGNPNIVSSLGPEVDMDGNLSFYGRPGPTHWAQIPEPPESQK